MMTFHMSMFFYILKAILHYAFGLRIVIENARKMQLACVFNQRVV